MILKKERGVLFFKVVAHIKERWVPEGSNAILLQKLQFVNLLLLLILGKITANLYLDPLSIFFILVISIAIEHLLLYIRYGKVPYFSYSGPISSLGIMLMVFSPYILIYVVLVVAALGQKHFFRYGGRHLFNPSNFAVIVALALFGRDAHIVLGQLGDAQWLMIFVLAVGGVILFLADRWRIPVVFTLVYLLLQKYMVVPSDPVMIFDEVVYRFYSISFIVFVLFMLTDPHTTPRSALWQTAFAVGVAMGGSWLDVLYGFRVQHLFLSLFLFSSLGMFSGWFASGNKERSIAILLFFMVIAVIIFIQSNPPYYFEMEHS